MIAVRRAGKEGEGSGVFGRASRNLDATFNLLTSITVNCKKTRQGWAKYREGNFTSIASVLSCENFTSTKRKWGKKAQREQDRGKRQRKWWKCKSILV